MKKVFVLGIIISCLWLTYRYPHVMLNPGELAEGHQKLNEKCFSCHEPFWGIPNAKCISCHQLSEIGRDTLQTNDSRANTGKILFHTSLERQKCTSCHTDHKGIKPDIAFSRFSHDLLPETARSKCNNCHNKPTDNLHQQLSASCNNCHNIEGWKSAVVFNHNMIQGLDKNNCVSCHQKPNDSFHLLFKDNCNKCHDTNRWVPSSFDHSAHFYLDQNHNVKCNICHTDNNFSAYSCYGCHEHSQSKLMTEHNEEGIYNFTNCVSCHKSADKHDMEGNKPDKKDRKKEDHGAEDDD